MVRASHAVHGLIFVTDADQERMSFRSVDDDINVQRITGGGDDCPIREADPLAFALAEELVANRPVAPLVFPPVGMDLAPDVGRETVGEAFHRFPVELFAWSLLKVTR